MGQALEMCVVCENKRGCDMCTDLHEWIMEHLEMECDLKAYKDAEQEGRLVVLPKESNCYDCQMLCGDCGGCLITGYPERPDKCHDIIRKKAEAALEAQKGGDEG